MDNKKKMMKKACGKGGPITAQTIRDINRADQNKIDLSKAPTPFQTIGSMVKGTVSSGIKGLRKVGNSVVDSLIAPSERVTKFREARDNAWRQEATNARKGILKNKVTPANFPTKSKKNSAGEIINPTKGDVNSFNSKFTTYRAKK